MLFVGGNSQDLVFDWQMLVVASRRLGLAALLTAPPPLAGVCGRRRLAIGPVRPLLGFACKQLPFAELQFRLELLDFGLALGQPRGGALMHALPEAHLLTQFPILSQQGLYGQPRSAWFQSNAVVAPR
jgi:hypothetical protein